MTMSWHLPAAATLVCVSAVANLVASEIRNHRLGRLTWKPLASLAFCLVPVLAGALDGSGPHHTVALCVMAGLVLGAVGDIALMYEARGFMAGLVAFLLGHVAYIVAFAYLVAPAAWLDGSVMPIVAVAAAAAIPLILRWLWARLGALRIPVIVYVAVISVMAVGGVAVVVHDNVLGTDARRLAAVGALAFYASDFAVARERFVGRDIWNRVVGLPVYYGAQLLIAWSISLR